MHGVRSLLPFLVSLAALSVWAEEEATLRVVSVEPHPPYSLGTTPPDSVVIDFNQPVLPSSINDWTVSGIGHDPTLTSPTQLTLAVSPSAPSSSYNLTLAANIESIVDHDARSLALELGEELTAPPELVAQVRDDLTAIYRSFPEMTAIRVRLPWGPGELLLGLTQSGQAMFESGTFHGLYALNETYGPVAMYPFSSGSLVSLVFDNFYHSEILASIYSSLYGVSWASPNYIIGDGPDIEAEPPYYTFSYGWGDCAAGCIYRHFWDFVVRVGTAVLLNEYGSYLSEPIEPRVIASVDGGVLDGEFNGTFPSGDGVEGGSFTVHWGECELFMENTDPTWLYHVDSFEVATGVLSELLANGEFTEATCLGMFDGGSAAITLPDPPPGNAQYFLARGTGECSAMGFGESTIPENPRSQLVTVCSSD